MQNGPATKESPWGGGHGVFGVVGRCEEAGGRLGPDKELRLHPEDKGNR